MSAKDVKSITVPPKSKLAGMKEQNILLGPGSRLVSGDMALIKEKYRSQIALLQSPSEISRTIAQNVANGEVFVFVEMIVYRTMFDTHHWFCATIVTDKLGKRFDFASGKQYNFDIPIDYPIVP